MLQSGVSQEGAGCSAALAVVRSWQRCRAGRGAGLAAVQGWLQCRAGCSAGLAAVQGWLQHLLPGLAQLSGQTAPVPLLPSDFSFHLMTLHGIVGIYCLSFFFTLHSFSVQECKFCARLLAVRWSEDTEGPSLGFEENSGNERESIVYKHPGERSC